MSSLIQLINELKTILSLDTWIIISKRTQNTVAGAGRELCAL